jgi:hypothetical protein
MFKFVCGFLFGVLFAMVGCVPAHAHDWYPPSCCSGKDCKMVHAYQNEKGNWIMVYDGEEVLVPPHAIKPDSENKDPLHYHGCATKVADEMGGEMFWVVHCFYRAGAGS